ncbi:MAG: PAS domain-containing sensor histidine kinase [Betaproteobacteria bacterium]|nr:PAS domain-containing sensor histidine kinase [Betaproteobacteria bacterium]
MTPAALAGLDLLATAVIVVDNHDVLRHMNPAAENLLELANSNVAGQRVAAVFADHDLLAAALNYARKNNCSFSEHDLAFAVAGRPRMHFNCTVTPIERSSLFDVDGCLIECRPIEQQLRIAREERVHDQSEANRELMRNLAHEIKNPLGGIRGAAQLLDHELDKPDLHEYTQVIMKEADRLQALMNRLLAPHRMARPAHVNIHEVLERVRSVLLAEYQKAVVIERDYDVSLPHIYGDQEQLIQAVLNIARNAAQALTEAATPDARIIFKTRAARQVVLARKRYRHAIEIGVIDNGPGVPPDIAERVFYPLVSGRDNGSGLGLTIAQNFVSQHNGTLTFESAPGHTCFTVLLPVADSVAPAAA